MKKNILFYFIAFIVIATVSLFFGRAYQELIDYTALTQRHNKVYSCFKNLSAQINNAAVSNPELINAKNMLKVRELFFADSISVIQHLSALKSAVRDSVNIRIANTLDARVRAEVSWLLQSNVPDSIVHHKATGHIASLKSIDSLIAQGIQRTIFLIEFRKNQLDETIKKIILWMIAFIILSGTMLVYTTLKFFKQKKQTLGAQKELDKTFREVRDYKYAIDQSSIVATTDQKGIITYVNDNFCNISKYAREELIGQDHHIINSSYHHKEFMRHLWETISNGKIWKGELKNRAKDGTIYWVDTTIVPFLTEQRNPYQYIAIQTDITDLKIAEEENEKSEIRFRNTLDKMLEGVEIIDFDFRYLYVNDAYEKQVKLSREELLGYSVMEKFPGIERTNIFNAIQQCFNERIPIYLEDEFTFPDHSKTWFEISFQPVPEGVFILSVDITDKRQAAEKIWQREERFRSLIENGFDIVSIIDKDLMPLYRSPAATRITGWATEDLEKKGSVEQAHPDDLARVRATLADVMKNPGIPFPLSYQTKHKDGHYIFIEGRVTNLLHNESIKGIVSNFRDVTETRKAEERIRLSEERFRSLIENSYDVVSIIDENFKPIYRSPSSVRVTGYSNTERDTIETAEQIHPDDNAKIKKIMKEVFDNPMVPYPLRLRMKHKAGHYILLEGMVTNMFHNSSIKGIVSNFHDITESQKAEDKIRESEKIYKTIASSIPGSVISLFDKDYRYLLIEGDMLESMGYVKEKLMGHKMIDVISPERYEEVLPNFRRVFQGESFMVEHFIKGLDILSKFVPLRDENNRVFAAMVVVLDVSELKETQRALAELNINLEYKIAERTLELEMVNKELESFSYSVAHDLRTPLRAIYGYASMLDEDYRNQFDDEGKRLIDVIGRNVKKMGILIDDLLAFSKLGRTQIQKSLINMNQIMETSLHALNLDVGYSGEIKINKLHSVMADFSLMKHVVINLLSNAIKYSSKKEKPVIEISSWQEKENTIYSVADNGAGFDMLYADKLFGVFQRLHTDKEFEGTGVGLAIVQRIIHRHGGKIWAKSEVNMGATFYFSLPAIPDAA